MLNHPIAAYLNDCRTRKATGAVTPETSLYAPLEVLLNAAGAGFKPSVKAFMNLKNHGGNLPDGGLFSPDQYEKDQADTPAGQTPSRGVIECKKPKDDVLAIADSEQVSRYWQAHSQVLVTNFREFVLIGRNDAGQRIRLEHFVLAKTEKEFWSTDIAKLAAELGEPCLDFLKRCLLRPAPITEPKDLAWFLASYAREAKARMEFAGNVPALINVQKALEQALGISFDTAKREEGERFFRSTLVQTLFYGLFSAWVLWHRAGPKSKERFEWKLSAYHLTVPVIRKLFHELSEPGKLEEWSLAEVLGWAGEVLNRADRAAFFGKFQDTEAVQYFYEPFLEQFDPELRKQLGVWYTPPEIVKYMVGRVDEILREDLNLEDGLANENVVVLDPCCGTGAYLVEVLRRIDETLKMRGDDSLRGAKLKHAATNRLFGFELLPAPFVVAHLQLGLELLRAGAPFNEKAGERPGVFLTNALTGWDPKLDATKSIFEEFNKEREAAEKVKRQRPILVILGNPPYNGYAGIAVKEERALTDSYRWNPGDPTDLKPEGQGLNDLYVRFFRMAERCILRELSDTKPAEGIVCFISNYSWLDSMSHPLMREKYLNGFDSIWVDSLHGNRIISEYAPDGRTSETVFAIRGQSPGIRIGTAIATMVRRSDHNAPAKVNYRDWSQAKASERRSALLASLKEKRRVKNYTTIKPVRILGLPFRPMKVGKEYTKWALLPDLFPTYFTGVKTSRDEFVVDIDKAVLERRIEMYFDSSVSNDHMKRISPRSLEETRHFSAAKARTLLQEQGIKPNSIVRFAYRPFDMRWLYWESDSGLLDRPRPDYFPQIFKENVWLSAVQHNRKEYDPPPFHPQLAAIHIIERSANVFPMLLKDEANGRTLFGERTGRVCHELGDHCVNLSEAAVEYLESRGGIKKAPSLFFHSFAVMHAPTYASENYDALRQDWPRIPLPNDPKLLKESGELGQRLSVLLDPDQRVPKLLAGKTGWSLVPLGVFTRTGGGMLDETNDFAINVNWGKAGRDGICMPSVGKTIERDYTPEERAALGDGISQLGETTFDVYLNSQTYWKCVPKAVWEYTLGGYQVLKKWLSYRESALLGRALRLEEVEYVQEVVRRIAAIKLLGPELDANYAAAKGESFAWG